MLLPSEIPNAGRSKYDSHLEPAESPKKRPVKGTFADGAKALDALYLIDNHKDLQEWGIRVGASGLSDDDKVACREALAEKREELKAPA